MKQRITQTNLIMFIIVLGLLAYYQYKPTEKTKTTEEATVCQCHCTTVEVVEEDAETDKENLHDTN